MKGVFYLEHYFHFFFLTSNMLPAMALRILSHGFVYIKIPLRENLGHVYLIRNAWLNGTHEI